MVLDYTSLTWLRLRECRSSLQTRSKLGLTAARRQTFAVAMGQFEEQFTAAKVVTPATRPLNLYYGLCQAGMAIAAAHADDPWSFNSHGLHLVERDADMINMKGRPEGDGGFQKVAGATNSPGITEAVSLGALWASLPDLSQAGVPPGSTRPVPLIFLADGAPTRRPRASLLLPYEMPAEGTAFVKRFGEIMTDYPGAAGIAIPVEEGAIRPPGTGGRWQVAVRWPAADSRPEMPEEELTAFYAKIAPEYRYRGDRFLRPAVDAAKSAAPSPLMTWWLLLYSFSILARYEPRRWAKLLDLDSSDVAAVLQYALEEALAAVPQLVLEAFDEEPSLLSKPVAF